MVIKAYFDDSVEPDTGMYVIGGYIGRIAMWDGVFNAAWGDVIKSSPHPISEFKASDCFNGRGEFSADRGWTRAERDAIRNAFVSVLADSCPKDEIAGVSCAMVVPPMPRTKEVRRLVEIHGFAQTLRVVFRAASVMGLVDLGDNEGKIALVCDNKPKFYEWMVKRFEVARDSIAPSLRQRIQTPHFLDSKDSFPLQAADLIAFETNREARARRKVPPDDSTETIIKLVKNCQHVAWCLDWEKIEDHIERHGPKAPGDSRLSPLLYETSIEWRSSSLWPYCDTSPRS